MNTLVTPTPVEISTSTPSPYSASRYLRWAGVVVLIVATADFLLQGIHIEAAAYRAWIILGFGMVLAILGLVCAYAWQETRGARAFLGLATALLPIQATQLGAQIHDQVWLPNTGNGSSGMAGIVISLAITALVFLPIGYTGFRMLARPTAPRLLAMTAAGCAILLLPWRCVLTVTPLLMLLWAGCIAASRPWFRHESELTSLEARIGLALTWIAPVIMAWRSLYYPNAALPLSATLCLVGLSLMQFRGEFLRISAELAGLVLCLIGWPNLIQELVTLGVIGNGSQPLATGLPVSLLLLLRTWRNTSSAFPVAGAWGACATALVSLYNQPGHDFALLALLVGIGVAIAGHRQRTKSIFILGLGGATLSLGYYVRYAVDLYRANSWLSLALVGVAAILLASYLDRPNRPLIDRLRRILSPERGWL